MMWMAVSRGPHFEYHPTYGSDGDYFSMPNVESIFDAKMSEVEPEKYPEVY